MLKVHKPSNEQLNDYLDENLDGCFDEHLKAFRQTLDEHLDKGLDGY